MTSTIDQAILARLIKENQAMALRIEKSKATLERLKKNQHRSK